MSSTLHLQTAHLESTPTIALKTTLLGGFQAPRHATLSRRRETVLPLKSGDSVPIAARGQVERFAQVRCLGRGGMGEVALVHDNDIRRNVAVKRLNDESEPEALLRFAEEVRTIGQLEHPGIVPVYDVGRDDKGKLFLVMKHLQGESMEDIITALKGGQAEHRERFTFEYRIRVFLGILDAVRYAHARGILHRDLKPANIQIGPYGEVTVLDWGIAKPISQRHPKERQTGRAHAATRNERLAQTEFGALLGTPLYMSPEQAAGMNDDLDERSDIYALCLLLFEWLTLAHPRGDKSTLTQLLAAIIHEDIQLGELGAHARRAGAPLEYVYIVARGLRRDANSRYQSIEELEQDIRLVLDGRVPVQCHVTLAKRAAMGFARFVDRHFALYTALFGLSVLGLFGAVAVALFRTL